MKYEGLKIYGMCLERIQHQIRMAKARIEKEGLQHPERVVLESYNTGDTDDIIDLLDLYDIADDKIETLRAKMDELASDVSLMMRETIEFDYSSEDGHLCLYWKPAKQRGSDAY